MDIKILKEKQLGEQLNLTIIKNVSANRIVVEFKSADKKLTTQKSFQDTYEGKKDADKFSKSMKNIKDLRKYFGLKETA